MWRPRRACLLEWRCCSAIRSPSIWSSLFPVCLQYVPLSSQTAKTDAGLTHKPLKLFFLPNICWYLQCTVFVFKVNAFFSLPLTFYGYFSPTMSYLLYFLHVRLSAFINLMGCVCVCIGSLGRGMVVWAPKWAQKVSCTHFKTAYLFLCHCKKKKKKSFKVLDRASKMYEIFNFICMLPSNFPCRETTLMKTFESYVPFLTSCNFLISSSFSLFSSITSPVLFLICISSLPLPISLHLSAYVPNNCLLLCPPT